MAKKDDRCPLDRATIYKIKPVIDNTVKLDFTYKSSNVQSLYVKNNVTGHRIKSCLSNLIDEYTGKIGDPYSPRKNFSKDSQKLRIDIDRKIFYYNLTLDQFFTKHSFSLNENYTIDIRLKSSCDYCYETGVDWKTCTHREC